MYNKKEVLDLIENYNKLEDFVYEFGKKLAKLRKTEFRGVDEIEISSTSIEIYMSYGCSHGCCTEYNHLSIPTEYLWTENWEEIEKERMVERAKAAIAAFLAALDPEEKSFWEEAEKAAAELAAKKAQYEKLKAEFEDE